MVLAALSRRRVATLPLVLAVVGSIAAAPQASASDDGDVRLLVTYGDAVAAGRAAGELRAASAGHDTTSRVQVLEFDDAASAQRAAGELAGRGDVVAVEPDVRLEAARMPAGALWGLDNHGQTIAGRAGRRSVDVGVTEAWRYARGRDVVVAVVDTGVDVSHPLLRDQLWRNPGETVDGTDSDGNGLVDDVHGWNFAAPDGGNGRLFRSAVEDSHGTHVAGTVAGARDTTSGFSGVAPSARIMVLKFMEGESGRVSDAIAAIRYAAAHGADVINASWSSTTSSTALRAALLESGLPVVAAAGNHGFSLDEVPTYPTAWRLPNVIGVAAVDHTGEFASFSARSRTLVDVAAPGTLITSTLPGGSLGEMSGTSQAAPHVVGAIALALQHHPDVSAATLADAVRASVRPLRSLSDTRTSGIVRAPALLDALGTRVPACRTETPPLVFTDVKVNSVHRDAVACLVATGVTQGRTTTRYGVSRGLTRAQVASMFARALEAAGALPPVPRTGRFVDVSATSVHRDAIEALAAKGVVAGRTRTRFDPGATTTRAEFAAIAARAAELLADGPVRASAPHFADTVGHADEALLRKAATLRVIEGYGDGTFRPGAPVRRDQAASMVSRMLDRATQQGLLPSR